MTEASVSHSLNAFIFDLAHKCREEQQGGNLAFSPLSINVALGMLFAGTRGSSAKEMTAALHLPEGKADSIHDIFQEVIKELKKETKLDVYSANCMFLQKNYEVKAEFTDTLKQYYLAEVKPVDFAENIEGSCKEINKWVEENTREKIKNIVSPSLLDAMTRIVLVNAVYFKGNWASPFKHQHTKKADFHLGQNKTVKVDMMSQKGGFRCAKLPDLKARALEIPYTGNKTAMLIILPDEIDGIDHLEANIKVSDIEKLSIQLSYDDDVILSLPKFKVEHTLALKPLLNQLGIKEIFTKNADLSGIVAPEKLNVSTVMHKCFLQVDEEGTVAAAATAIGIALMCARLPTHFTVDHAFLFLVYNLEANTILFMGSIREP